LPPAGEAALPRRPGTFHRGRPHPPGPPRQRPHGAGEAGHGSAVQTEPAPATGPAPAYPRYSGSAGGLGTKTAFSPFSPPIASSFPSSLFSPLWGQDIP